MAKSHQIYGDLFVLNLRCINRHLAVAVDVACCVHTLKGVEARWQPRHKASWYAVALAPNSDMGGSETPVIARPLDPRDPKLPETVRDILEKGKRSWLKNTEVCDMLLNHNEFNLRVAKEPPRQPPGRLIRAVARLQVALGILV